MIAAAVSAVIAVRRIIFAVIGRLVGRADDDHAFRVPVHRKAERIADVAQLVVVVVIDIIASQLHGLVPHSDRRCRGRELLDCRDGIAHLAAHLDIGRVRTEQDAVVRAVPGHVELAARTVQDPRHIAQLVVVIVVDVVALRPHHLAVNRDRMYRRGDFNARLCRGCGFLHSGFCL